MMSFEADYVIIGAGTAGCVLANRLSADATRSVILVEAGERDRHPYIHIPAGFVRLLDHPRITWQYRTAAEAMTHGRQIVFPRGRGLGGSSAINGLLYARPFAEDIDAWERQGAAGWNFNACLPYYKRSETWTEGAHPNRGTDGPIQVGRVGDPPEICAHIIDAAREAGFEFLDDPNATTRGPSIWYYQQTRDGRRRSSAARGYLRPARTRRNLRIVTGALVSSLQMDGATATGVTGTSRGGTPFIIKARAEVILAAGVIGTPKLLELSGIGDPDVLASAGIRPKIALPGVGRNFQDHYVARLCFRAEHAATANERSHGIRLVREVLNYAVFGKGLLTYSAAIAGAFATTAGSTRPDVQYVIAPGSFKSGTIGELEDEPGISCGCWQMRPESRGSVHIERKDPTAAPRITAGYLTHPSDGKTMVEGFKIARQIFAQPAIAPYIVAETIPGPDVASDAQLLDYISRNGSTVYHAIGTCRMGEDDMSVVDASLRVRGVSNLRVIDGSVFPFVTSTNTNATVLMLAERGADIIMRDTAHPDSMKKNQKKHSAETAT